MITPLATRLDVINNGRYSRVGIASRLSPVPVARRGDLRVARKGFTAAATQFRIPGFKGANALLWLLRLIFDQAFRHSRSLARCRLEFLAARIVIKNKEVLNFAYQL